jgi:hypothetical protein
MPSTSELCHFCPKDGGSVFLKQWQCPTKVHSAKSQNIIIIIIILILTNVKASNLIYFH